LGVQQKKRLGTTVLEGKDVDRQVNRQIAKQVNSLKGSHIIMFISVLLGKTIELYYNYVIL